MKRFYALLFNISLISSYGVAKTGKIDAKYEAEKMKSLVKSAKVKSSKLINYSVGKGDTLYSIAKKHHTTVAKIELVNGIKNENRLKVGTSLKVPSAVPVDMSEKKIGTVKTATAKKKEQLAKKEVHKEKPGKSQNSSKKAIASTKAKSSKKVLSKTTTTHKVVKGDSLYSIARKNHTTVKELKKINKIKSERSLKLGQLLIVPGSLKVSDGKSKIAEADKNLDKNRKVAKTKSSSGKKTKLAKHEKKSKKKIASSRRKFVIDADGSTKKSFLSSLSFGDKSPVKLSAAKKQLGKRYVWGATGPRNFDCSGFTSYVCKKSGVCIPRTSIAQSKTGKRVSRRNLKPGDLVFFDTSKRHRGYVNHVGIYLGNNKFIHASSAKRRVIITSLEKPFYKSRFKWGSRIKG